MHKDAESLGSSAPSIGNARSYPDTESPGNFGPAELWDGLVRNLQGYAVVALNATGLITHWNVGATRLTGYPASDAVGRHFSLLYVAEEIAAGAPDDDLLRAAATGEITKDGICLTNAGEHLWVALTVTALKDERHEVQGYALVIRDTTEQRRSERATRLMVDLALNALILVDHSGKIVRANPQTEKLFGYSINELIGQSVELLVPDAVRPRHPGYRDAFFDNPAIRAMGAGRDLYGRRKDGSEFPVEIGLNPVQSDDELLVLGSIVDISERKRAEQRFRLAVESAPSAMVMVNEQGEIVLVNLQTERMFGYERDQLMGQPIEMLVPERFQDRHPVYRRSFFTDPTARPMGAGRDLHGRRRDGSEFPVEIGLTPIDTGEGWLVLSAIVDITERKEAEVRTRLHLAEMAHALRLSTVGEMFSGLAHEINQPLAAAANYARACVRMARSEQGADKDQLIEWMDKTAAQAARAIDIVKRVGAFVRRERSKQTALDLNSLINEVLALPALAIGGVEGASSVTLDLDFQQPLPNVLADRVQIEQVLVNLARNAIEAMADVPPARRRLLVRTASSPQAVEVTVTDCGHGIDEEKMSKLFNPFFTTKAEGMGLGLSISRSIIEAHQGQMSAESQKGVGTTFRFSLPSLKEEGRP